MAGAAGLEPTFPVLETGVLTSVRSAHITEKPFRISEMVCDTKKHEPIDISPCFSVKTLNIEGGDNRVR